MKNWTEELLNEKKNKDFREQIQKDELAVDMSKKLLTGSTSRSGSFQPSILQKQTGQTTVQQNLELLAQSTAQRIVPMDHGSGGLRGKMFCFSYGAFYSITFYV